MMKTYCNAFTSLAAAGVIAVAASAFSADEAEASTVDLELLLLTDVSGSVDADDFDLFKTGYAAAFRSAALINKVAEGAIGKIAVAVGFWSTSSLLPSGTPQQLLATDWTVIDDASSGDAFATVIEGLARPFDGRTAMAAAIDWGAGLFATNGIEGTRQVIDVVADGAESELCSEAQPICAPLQNARDAALASGVDAINALFIRNEPFFGMPSDTIDALLYGETNVIGGPGSFVTLIDGFADFAEAIEEKLIRETAPPPPNGVIPLPAAGWLLLGGLGALGLLRRRKAATA